MVKINLQNKNYMGDKKTGLLATESKRFHRSVATFFGYDCIHYYGLIKNLPRNVKVIEILKIVLTVSVFSEFMGKSVMASGFTSSDQWPSFFVMLNTGLNSTN